MGKKQLFSICIFTLVVFSAFSQEYNYKFRLYLTDKGTTQYTIGNPQDYLSQRAIDRRQRQGINIDESDLPISTQYINEVEELGCVVVAKSKWLRTLVVDCTDSLTIDSLKVFPFVKSTSFVWKGKNNMAKIISVTNTVESTNSISEEYYGQSKTQIYLNNGQKLHDAGYKGEGIEIAVIDAGYKNLNEISLLDNISVLGIKDFVYQQGGMLSSLAHVHGLSVLSTMATNVPNQMVGTAPDAKYWLLRSEDVTTEFPVEEDYWVNAAEYADSVGVDIINTSLAYYAFDFPAVGYTHDDLDGKKAFVSQGAEIATKKGIFVVASAGNERANNNWNKICVPSDAESVLTVGAVYSDSLITSFSSYGPSADGRVKPDVVTMGSNIATVDPNNFISRGASGTSFSAPIMSGMAACLWQAAPSLTNMQLLDIIKKSGNKYTNSDADFGYGLPDMEKALDMAMGMTSSGIDRQTVDNNMSLFGISHEGVGVISINEHKHSDQKYQVAIYSLLGQKVYEGSFVNQTTISLNNKDRGVFVIYIRGNNVTESRKIFF